MPRRLPSASLLAVATWPPRRYTHRKSRSRAGGPRLSEARCVCYSECRTHDYAATPHRFLMLPASCSMRVFIELGVLEDLSCAAVRKNTLVGGRKVHSHYPSWPQCLQVATQALRPLRAPFQSHPPAYPAQNRYGNFRNHPAKCSAN